MEDLLIADLDRTLGFTIPSRNARGRFVRLGPVLDAVVEAGYTLAGRA